MSFVQNYIGLEARIEAVVRRLLADFDIDLSNYPTFDEMNQAIAEAIAGGGGGGGTNNYRLADVPRNGRQTVRAVCRTGR